MRRITVFFVLFGGPLLVKICCEVGAELLVVVVLVWVLRPDLLSF